MSNWRKSSPRTNWKAITTKPSPTTKIGNLAKSCRMAIGSLIIKERMKLSDIETVELIRENPYMQYFIGMRNFSDHAQFDVSTITFFRKRLAPEILSEINRLIVIASKSEDDSDLLPEKVVHLKERN